jgi:hypothetical protein
MARRPTLDPRAVDDAAARLGPRRELICRLAIRGLSDSCRKDRQFRRRTAELVVRFSGELGAALEEAARLSAELAGRR